MKSIHIVFTTCLYLGVALARPNYLPTQTVTQKCHGAIAAKSDVKAVLEMSQPKEVFQIANCLPRDDQTLEPYSGRFASLSAEDYLEFLLGSGDTAAFEHKINSGRVFLPWVFRTVPDDQLAQMPLIYAAKLNRSDLLTAFFRLLYGAAQKADTNMRWQMEERAQQTLLALATMSALPENFEAFQAVILSAFCSKESGEAVSFALPKSNLNIIAGVACADDSSKDGVCQWMETFLSDDYCLI
ncbi:hypothetical protein H4R33_002004 [Dimargaris cristalligena]|nr:hypothetical protein H4R33_002004 [Dimargaris cristalligena]